MGRFFTNFEVWGNPLLQKKKLTFGKNKIFSHWAAAPSDRSFFQHRTPGCRLGLPLVDCTNLPCAPPPLVAGSRRWRHRVRLDEAVISSAEGATLFGLGEPLSPSLHLPARVAPPPSRRCQSLTGGALAAGGQGSSRRRLPAWPPSRRASKARRQPAFSHAK